MSPLPLGILALSGAGAGAFTPFLGFVASDSRHFGIADDDDGIAYVVQQSSSQNYHHVYAIDNSLTHLWTRASAVNPSVTQNVRRPRMLNRHPSGSGVAFGSVARNGSGQPYQLYQEISAAGSTDGFTAYTSTSGQGVYGLASNSTYTGYAGEASYRGLFLLTSNWDTSPDLQSQYQEPSFSDSLHSDIGTDSSGNFYLFGKSRLTSAYWAHLFKYSSTGSLIFKKNLSNDNVVGEAMAVAPDGTTYCQLTDLRIIKANSSGTIQAIWDPNLNQNNYHRLACDADGNLYFFADYYNGSFTETVLVKVNSSGTILWQRSFRWNSVNAGVNALRIGADGSVLFGIENFFGRYPADGSITGSWSIGGNTVTIANSSAVTLNLQNFWSWDTLGGSLSTPSQTIASENFYTLTQTVTTQAI